MKKLSKKALFGIGAGVLAAAVGAGLLLKKKANTDDYVDADECYDEGVEVEDDVESEE